MPLRVTENVVIIAAPKQGIRAELVIAAIMLMYLLSTMMMLMSLKSVISGWLRCLIVH